MSISSEIERISSNVSGAFTAISDKGGTVPVAATSEDLADAIETIPAGLDTSDATATAEDILEGLTAYVDGELIEGTYVPLDTSDATATEDEILEGFTAYVNGELIEGAYVPDAAGNVSYELFEVSVNSASPIFPLPLTGDPETLSKLSIGAIAGQENVDQSTLNDLKESGYMFGCVIDERFDIVEERSLVTTWSIDGYPPLSFVQHESPSFDSATPCIEHSSTYFCGTYWVLAIYEG